MSDNFKNADSPGQSASPSLEPVPGLADTLPSCTDQEGPGAHGPLAETGHEPPLPALHHWHRRRMLAVDAEGTRTEYWCLSAVPAQLSQIPEDGGPWHLELDGEFLPGG